MHQHGRLGLLFLRVCNGTIWTSRSQRGYSSVSARYHDCVLPNLTDDGTNQLDISLLELQGKVILKGLLPPQG
jgi:hypothetical protein